MVMAKKESVTALQNSLKCELLWASDAYTACRHVGLPASQRNSTMQVLHAFEANVVAKVVPTALLFGHLEILLSKSYSQTGREINDTTEGMRQS